MTEAARTSETVVNFYQTTWHYNPENRYLQLIKHTSIKSLVPTPITNALFDISGEIDGTPMKCISFYCNIFYELKGTVTESKTYLSTLYDQVSVTCNL
jgi:hypothetical protein